MRQVLYTGVSHVEYVVSEAASDGLPALDDPHEGGLVVRGEPGRPLVPHQGVLELAEIVQSLGHGEDCLQMLGMTLQEDERIGQ